MNIIKKRKDYWWWCFWCGKDLITNNQIVPLNEKNKNPFEYFCNKTCKEEFIEAN